MCCVWVSPEVGVIGCDGIIYMRGDSGRVDVCAMLCVCGAVCVVSLYVCVGMSVEGARVYVCLVSVSVCVGVRAGV